MTTEHIDDEFPSENTESSFDLSLRVEELEHQLWVVRDEQLRERADMENQRRRLIRDAEQARRFANEKLLADLLPVFDSLEAGLAACGEHDASREGIELTLRQLHRVAEANGLSVVDPAGSAFNPEWHQAMSMVPVEGTEAGTVVQVYQKGYVLNDRLLRPALVVVAAE